MKKIINMETFFTKKEAINLMIISSIISAFIFSVGGYFLGRNYDRAEFYKIALEKEKRRQAAEEQFFGVLKRNDSFTIKGNEENF